MAPSSNVSRQRRAVAAAAARLVAEDGLDYAAAKAKAAQQVIGLGTPKRDALPDDEEIEEALREYHRLFQSDTQPARLTQMRRTALAVMRLLPEHELFLVGAVANGTAGEHDAVYLQSYIESSKDLHIDLLNAGVDAEADEVANPFGRGRVERLTFWLDGETVHITCYPPNRARQIGDRLAERLDRTQVEALLAAQRGAIRRSLLFALVGIAALGLGAGIGRGVRSASSSSEPESAATQRLFATTLVDADGRPQPLGQWRGKPLIVNFWATWCTPCVEEMPELQRLRADYAGRGVEVIGIAIDNPKAVAEFRSRIGIAYPLLIGGIEGTDLARALGNRAGGLPFTLVVDRHGRIDTTHLGRIQAGEMRTRLDNLLTTAN